jgi:hypothetical protein
VAGFNSFFFIVLFLLWGTAVFSVNLFGVLWLTGGSPHRFGFCTTQFHIHRCIRFANPVLLDPATPIKLRIRRLVCLIP